MNLEKAKNKYKLYNGLFVSIIFIIFIMFSMIFTPTTTGANIFAFSVVPLIICFLIFKYKRKYYKKLIYDLSINENAIKDTLNDKHLK